MMLRRRMPSATPSSTHTPSSSGPRWRMTSHMRCDERARCALESERRRERWKTSTKPAMPHMRKPSRWVHGSASSRFLVLAVVASTAGHAGERASDATPGPSTIRASVSTSPTRHNGLRPEKRVSRSSGRTAACPARSLDEQHVIDRCRARCGWRSVVRPLRPRPHRHPVDAGRPRCRRRGRHTRHHPERRDVAS